MQKMASQEEKELTDAGLPMSVHLSVKRYTLEEIKSCTDDFSIANKIELKCWETVYKGMVDGKKVAVRIDMHSDDDVYSKWKEEIEHLSKLMNQGVNVIELLGVCRTTHRLFVVYPLYERGDLEENIQDLNWEMAKNILIKIAKVLKKVHESELTFWGFKATDILLDEDSNPIWTNSLRATLKSEKIYEKEDNFKRLEGYVEDYQNIGEEASLEEAYGYVGGEFCDIYSMGILMLQILLKEKEIFKDKVEKKSGVSSCLSLTEEQQEHIGEHAKLLTGEYVIHSHYIENGCDVEVAKRALNLAIECLHEKGSKRPQPDELVAKLSEIFKSA